jgi:membrane protease YdiL (CAAX protease family)
MTLELSVTHVLSQPVVPVTLASSERPAPMRPMWVLIGIFLAMALWGALAQRQAAHAAAFPRPASPAAIYAGLILTEWGLALYVWRAGLGRRRGSLRELIGGRWSRPRDVAVDAAIGLLTWALWSAVSLLWRSWSGPDTAASIDTLLPHRPHEILLWIVLSMSAGFSEELVFRGYLQRQFQALTGSAPLALVLQAALFGVSHGYQGVRACLRIAVYGLLFGGLAMRRRSLRPGMIAHAWTDIASGLF